MSGAVSEAATRLRDRVSRWTDQDYLGDDRLEVDDALELADDISAVLAALTPAPQAEGEQADPYGPLDNSLIVPQPLQQGGEVTRADLGDLAGLVERLEARVEAVPEYEPDTNGGVLTTGGGFKIVMKPDAMTNDAARTIRSLASDRDKAVGLLEAANLALQTAADTIKVTRGPMGSFYRTETPPESLYALSVLIGQVLSSQTEGR